ncbi:unnamed protein product [Ilex paraguariensis]|uniref:Uncharacterized protein n=1 Tax=Ilex paraguariensis TaxID=185542 RepID=A0ABC8TB17_9AQUA
MQRKLSHILSIPMESAYQQKNQMMLQKPSALNCWIEDTCSMGVLIINADARLEHRVAMKFLTVVTVITRLRIPSTSSRNLDMISRAIRFNRSYAHCVALSKRFGKFASTVVYVWADISVELASYLMMIHLRSSIIAMAVASAGLVARRIFFIATDVVKS